MFEEICLVCGKALQDDGAAYCSDDCQNIDLTSPSISSASSTRSSPHLPYAIGGDVPPLVPSALGSALHNFRGRDHYSISSSSTSSTSWSVLTDDDDDGDGDDDDDDVLVDSEYSFQDGNDSIHDSGTKSPHFFHHLRPSAMSYARRPSGTNNHSTVPLLHKRTSSGSSPGHVGGVPRSAPIRLLASAEEDEVYSSDFGFSSRDELTCDSSEPYTENDCETDQHKLTITKTKSKRNRASLPAYFSLLQIGGSPAEHRSSPKSTSSVHTVSRPSPPTPKSALTAVTGFPLPHPSIMQQPSASTPPRGRRREPGTSRGSRRSRNSGSRSRSWSRSRNDILRPHNLEFEMELEPIPRAGANRKGNIEQVVDWLPMNGVTRGRAHVRRNSSPLPKMLLPTVALDDHNRANATVRKSVSGSAADSRKTRGRLRTRHLDGVGSPSEAPGYGVGRSGLLDRRGRLAGSRGHSGLR